MITLYLILSFLATPQDSHLREISFGHGGGIIGAVHAYSLSKEGEVFKVNVYSARKTLVCNIGIKDAESIFKKVNEYALHEVKLNEPGNTYKYVELVTGESKHKLTWSGKSANKNLNLLYKELKSLCKLNE